MLPSPFSPLPSPLSLSPLSSPLSPLLSPSPLSLSPLPSPFSPLPSPLFPLPSPFLEGKREKGLRASDYMAYMSILYILFLADSLNFIYMSSYSTVESGDDYYSSRITPDTSLPFGNSPVSRVYVSTYII